MTPRLVVDNEFSPPRNARSGDRQRGRPTGPAHRWLQLSGCIRAVAEFLKQLAAVVFWASATVLAVRVLWAVLAGV